MERFSAFVLRHRLAVTLTWLALAVAGIFTSARVGDRLQAQGTMPGRPAYEANLAIARTYGSGGSSVPLVPVITLPAGQRPGSPGVRAALSRSFAAGARAAHGRAVSYADTGDQRLVGRDGRTTYGFVFLPSQQAGFQAEDGSGPVTAAMRSELPPGATMRVTGIQALSHGGRAGGPSVLTETIFGAVGALAVLIFVFGSFLAFVPLLVAGFSILTSFLIVYGLTEITDVSLIVSSSSR